MYHHELKLFFINFFAVDVRSCFKEKIVVISKFAYMTVTMQKRCMKTMQHFHFLIA